MFTWIMLALAIVIADQFTKFAVVSKMALGESVDVISGVFRFTYIRNRGAAFGMLSEHRWVFIVLSCVAIAGIVVYVIVKRPKDRLLMTSLSMIAGGGIGNLIDRILLGYVIDFLDFCAFPSLWKWIFNVADASACIGAGLLALYLILEMKRENRLRKEDGGEPSGESGGSASPGGCDDAG